MTALATNRRSLLTGLGALYAWSFAPRHAAAAGRDPRLLVVILRGGLDGLAAVAPLGDPNYNALREGFGLTSETSTLPLDSFFALNANLPTLADLYRAGHAAIVHAVATPYRGRSHFDGQDTLESGYPSISGSLDSGWLNRALEVLPRGERLQPAARAGLSISPTIPVIMRGKAPVETWQPQAFRYADDDTIGRLLDLYEARDPALAQGLRDGAGLDQIVLAMNAGQPGKKIDAGRRTFVTEAAAAARFMSRDEGPRIGAMSFYGWDTHSAEGPASGTLALQLKSLDDSLAALRSGFGPVWDDTVVLVTTEFGRTVRINGSRGTDHGTATAAFLIGGAVKGGRIISDWPGLAEKNLFENRDLAPTTDLRSVVKGVLAEHLGFADGVLGNHVFPDSALVKPMRGLCA